MLNCLCTLCQDLEVILEVLHAAQQAMSSESTPTLSGAVPTFERLIEGWNHIANHFPHFAPLISIGLLWADKYDDRMGATNAYAVSMFIDPASQMSWMEHHWGQQQTNDAKKFIMKLMHAKRGTLASGSAPTAGAVQKPTMLGSHLYGLPDIDMPSDCSGGAQTASQGMFPTVFAIALDYLPIQASAVLCKHVFSSSSETDMQKWNRLSPVLMEALQIIKFILKKDRLNFTKGWSASQRDMEYKVLRDVEPGEVFTPNISKALSSSSTHKALLKAIADHECDDVDDATIIYPSL
ncbi:hypothetical protein BDR03DRAFT_984456 [Suillus americanus]|nr:hypothetical protein BDR03DRAFT_984456 [Suillus americanus]